MVKKKVGARSFLEPNTVGATTQALCTGLYHKRLEWTRKHAVAADTDSTMDDALVRWLNEMIFECIASSDPMKLGSPAFPPLPQLRHGGVLHELAAKARSLPEIKKRGRWSSNLSSKRNGEGARLPQQLALIPMAQRDLALQEDRRIGKLLASGSRE